MLPFDLPPPPPIVSPVDEMLLSAPEAPRLWAQDPPKATQKSPEEQNFHRSVSKFQQHLSKLSPQHRAELKKIHVDVTKWAEQARASGQRADKLSTFVGKVMEYSDNHLANIEKADPELQQFKAEHKQFQNLFLAGNDVIEAYLTWVRADYPKSKPIPKKT